MRVSGIFHVLIQLHLFLYTQSNIDKQTSSTTSSFPLLTWIPACSFLLALLAYIGKEIYPKIQEWRDATSLSKGMVSKFYTKEQIKAATYCYIRPQCQSIDPAGSEDQRAIMAPKQDFFEFIDEAIFKKTIYKYVFILADSGMGKTSFLLNYYARHKRRGEPEFKIAIIPLNSFIADKEIEAIADKEHTMLFLDALDEDILAVIDLKERIKMIIENTILFPRIVITCRTQFFSKESEIPLQTGIINAGKIDIGESAELLFHKVYISLFSDKQIKKYLSRRFPLWKIWRLKTRLSAKKILKSIEDLSARPMLLSHIDDVMKLKKPIDNVFDLYTSMVDAWLSREERSGFRGEGKATKEELFLFSKKLAMDIYIKRKERGFEKIPRDLIHNLAKEWGITVDEWRLTGRSLLNRDSHGYYKFAHRSILEYLLVVNYVSGNKELWDEQWTDQMLKFLWALIKKEVFTNPNKEIERFQCFAITLLLDRKDINEDICKCLSKLKENEKIKFTLYLLKIVAFFIHGITNIEDYNDELKKESVIKAMHSYESLIDYDNCFIVTSDQPVSRTRQIEYNLYKKVKIYLYTRNNFKVINELPEHVYNLLGNRNPIYPEGDKSYQELEGFRVKIISNNKFFVYKENLFLSNIKWSTFEKMFSILL